MKKLYIFLLLVAGGKLCQGQNAVYAPTGVYGSSYFAATTIGNGGYAVVGDDGSWYLGGNITSNDKGNDNAPTATGRSEYILFSGTGTYANAASAISGATGNIIDGYAGASGKSSAFVLPVGVGNTNYPVTVPGATQTFAAYFVGSGSTQSTAQDNFWLTGYEGNPVTVYSPYIDMPNGIPAGDYVFSYPAGFDPTSPVLLESGNTSAGGTSSSTSYGVLKDLSATSYSATPASVGASSLAAKPATQVYFAITAYALPVEYAKELTAVKEGTTVQLAWTTAIETNNKGFAVQRSTDGKNFATIGYVGSNAINGNSSQAVRYTYPDAAPVTGINYYRLQQEDRDGKTALGRVVSIDFDGAVAPTVKLYPNPVSDNVLKVAYVSTGSQLSIFSLDGKLLKTQTVTADPQEVNVSGIPSGYYLLKVTSKDGKQTSLKFMKK